MFKLNKIVYCLKPCKSLDGYLHSLVPSTRWVRPEKSYNQFFHTPNSRRDLTCLVHNPLFCFLKGRRQSTDSFELLKSYMWLWTNWIFPVSITKAPSILAFFLEKKSHGFLWGWTISQKSLVFLHSKSV